MSVKLRSKSLKNGKKSLYLDIYFDDQRKYEFLKLYVHSSPKNTQQKDENAQARQLANEIRAKRELELVSLGHGIVPEFKKKMDFFTFADTFLQRWKESSMYREYDTTINHFKKSLGRDKIPINAINVEVVERFKAYLFSNAELNGGTPFNYFARFKTIMKQAEKEGLIMNNPVNMVKNKRLPPTIKTTLTPDEIQKLAMTPLDAKDLKRAFIFSCYSGLAYVDVKQLCWIDIQNDILDGRRIKTNEEYIIQLNNVALKMLGDKRGEPNQKVFSLYHSIGYADKKLQEWAKVAGIEKHITYHVARHSFATNLLRYSTESELTVSKLMGLSSTKYVATYARIAQSQKDDAIFKLPQIDLTNFDNAEKSE